MVAGDVAHGAIGDGLGIAGRVGAADEPEHVGHLPGATELAEVLAGGRRLRFVRGVAIRPRSRGLSRRLPNRRTRGVPPPGPARLPSKRPPVPGYSRLIRAQSATPQYASSPSSYSSDTTIVGRGRAGRTRRKGAGEGREVGWR